MVELGLVDDEAEAAGAEGGGGRGRAIVVVDRIAREVGRMKGDTTTHRYVNGADVIRERE